MLLLKKGEWMKKPPVPTMLVQCSFYHIKLSYLGVKIREFIKHIPYTPYRIIYFSN